MNANNSTNPAITIIGPNKNKEEAENNKEKNRDNDKKDAISIQRSTLPSVSSNRSALSMHLEGMSWNDELTMSLLEGFGMDGHTDMFSLNSLLDNLTLSGDVILSAGSGSEQDEASDNETRLINKLNRMRRRVRWDNVSTTTVETETENTISKHGTGDFTHSKDLVLSVWMHIQFKERPPYDFVSAPVPRLLVQRFVQANIAEIINAPQYQSFVMGIHRLPMDFLHKGPVIQKVCPYAVTSSCPAVDSLYDKTRSLKC